MGRGKKQHYLAHFLARKSLLFNEVGQASIMLGAMLVTFILFFAFTVNTGMLINAKINLQNAADLAAYSGAATQARQLNNIAFLNYEMRRQFKKFLFRYYVLGNMAQQAFPRNVGPATKYKWSPDAGGTDYGVPFVCIIFNDLDNFCQRPILPAIKIPSTNPLDSISTALAGQLKTIEDIRRANCKNIGFTNNLILMLWLYNTDPDLTDLPGLVSNQQKETMAIIRSLAYGLGLVPRQMINMWRIQTLENYLNQKSQTVRFSDIQNLKQQSVSDPEMNARTINAYLSAYQTLGPSTYSDSENIVMEELMPDGGDPNHPGGAAIVQLDSIDINFNAYALQFTSTGDCKPEPVEYVVPGGGGAGFAVGFKKNPNVLTYYAIRLQAEANVLFSPFGKMKMEAYSAAQPFGSRLGPDLKQADFTHDQQPFGKPNPVKIPFMSVGPPGGNWERQDFLGMMYRTLEGAPGAPGGRQTFNLANFQQAYHYATYPTADEPDVYNIINDNPYPGDNGYSPDLKDAFNRFFDTEHRYRFWAPVFAGTRKMNQTQAISESIDKLFQGSTSQGAVLSTGGGTGADIVPVLKQKMDEFLNKNLAQSKGGDQQNQESYNIAVLDNPFFSRPGDPMNSIAGAGDAPQSLFRNLSKIAGNAKALQFFVDPGNTAQYRTSWNNTSFEASLTQGGRIGYSVKFVSLSDLAQGTIKTNTSGGTPTNLPKSADKMINFSH